MTYQRAQRLASPRLLVLLYMHTLLAHAVALTHHHLHSGQGRTYHAIARHYGWALAQLFDEKHHKKVIMLEDDMEIAPDFFDYFAAAGGLLYEDPTLLCVSAWNDNGQKVSRNTHTHTHSVLLSWSAALLQASRRKPLFLVSVFCWYVTLHTGQSLRR